MPSQYTADRPASRGARSRGRTPGRYPTRTIVQIVRTVQKGRFGRRFAARLRTVLDSRTACRVSDRPQGHVRITAKMLPADGLDDLDDLFWASSGWVPKWNPDGRSG